MENLLPELPPDAFCKIDDGDDRAFYAPPRLVTHIDGAATAALTAFYGVALPRGGTVLDFMSSWVSHLPADLSCREIIGHGMNAEELAANPRLDRWFVQDLNADPRLPLAAAQVEAAICCVGVQYLQHPVAVLADVRRILRPTGLCAISFSNRCFPTKAVAIWRALDADGHAALVRLYLERAGFQAIEIHVLSDGSRGDPLTVVTGRAPRADTRAPSASPTA